MHTGDLNTLGATVWPHLGVLLHLLEIDRIDREDFYLRWLMLHGGFLVIAQGIYLILDFIYKITDSWLRVDIAVLPQQLNALTDCYIAYVIELTQLTEGGQLFPGPKRFIQNLILQILVDNLICCKQLFIAHTLKTPLIQLSSAFRYSRSRPVGVPRSS
ncbi:hypothetical protein SDC9_158532 [bioreactor metagenome]|uniref:Uncharacterized protein n=1 Tax=bioreactor metagenome TaxID=1076179 RepID=A0A645FA92_9ZZZZ